jgi:hypothetical protein
LELVISLFDGCPVIHEVSGDEGACRNTRSGTTS